jgi:Mce-associated membrane protein
MTPENPSTPPDNDAVAQLLAAADEAEAEAAAAEAESRAAAARARAIKLRREAVVTPEIAADEPAESAEPVEPAVNPLLNTTPTAQPGRGLPIGKVLAVGAAVLVICAGAGASGFLLWKHHTVEQRQQRSAEFSAAARQGVVNLMTVNFDSAKEDVQRLLDSSTGKFHDDLQSTAADLTTSLEQSNVTTTVTVQSSAIESMSADTGVVLVAARSEASAEKKGSPRPPADWRLAVTLTRDNGQLKMSAVDFVSK